MHLHTLAHLYIQERVIDTVDPSTFSVIVVEMDGSDAAKDKRVSFPPHGACTLPYGTCTLAPKKGWPSPRNTLVALSYHLLQVEEKILKAGLRRQAHSYGSHPAEGAIGRLHASVVYLDRRWWRCHRGALARLARLAHCDTRGTRSPRNCLWLSSFHLKVYGRTPHTLSHPPCPQRGVP